jgi:hypothetical protein
MLTTPFHYVSYLIKRGGRFDASLSSIKEQADKGYYADPVLRFPEDLSKVYEDGSTLRDHVRSYTQKLLSFPPSSSAACLVDIPSDMLIDLLRSFLHPVSQLPHFPEGTHNFFEIVNLLDERFGDRDWRLKLVDEDGNTPLHLVLQPNVCAFP